MTSVESLSGALLEAPSPEAWAGPVPVPDRDSAFFWAGLREHRLLVLECGACANLVYPPMAGCPRCAGAELEPRELAGTGTVYSFTVVNREFAPGIRPPYVVALVALDEQPDVRVVTNIVGTTVGDVRIGQRVRAVFQDVRPETTLAFFAPLEEDA